MTRQPGIYAITHELSGKMYIGSAANIARRFRQHRTMLNTGVHHNPYLLNAWIKYGREAFAFDVVEFVSNKASLLDREQVWLDFFKPEFNICRVAGSPFGRRQSDATKEKLRTLNLGKGASPENLKKLHQHNRDRTYAPHTEARREINRKAQTGKKLSQEHKEKLRIALLGKNRRAGRKHSEETRAKVSASLMGNKRTLGRKASPEEIEKNRQSQLARWRKVREGIPCTA